MNQVSHTRSLLYEYLSKLDKDQLKVFYGMLVHYRVSQGAFISKKNVFNLWCELNVLCHEIDEGFPDIYDHALIKSYCQAHPYYFIDILPTKMVISLFWKHFDDKLDLLATMVQKLDTEGLRAAYACINEAMSLSEDVDELVLHTEEHMKAFS